MNKQNKIRKSLIYSFWDGFFASCMSGLIADYITPYALILKATIRQIGFLASLPYLASSLAQLKSADITDRLASRKKAICIFIFIHAVMLVPITLIPYLFKSQPVLFLIIFMTLFNGFNALVVPVWSGLMAEYIPPGMRGRYFGWRNKVMSIILIVTSLIAGLILQYFRNAPLKGFLIIFSLAFLSRLISWYFLTRMYEPYFKIDKNAYFSLLDFIKGIRKSNFARFVLFISGMQFCVNLAAPFFSVFMLRELKFNYITYTVIVATVTALQILTIGRWGRCADRVGNVKVLKLTALIIASLPLWWVISQNRLYLIVAQAASGFAWAGFNLCAGNFVYDVTTAQKRIRCLGYLSVFVGLAVFLGGIIGGYLANVLPDIFGYKLLSLFFISSALRFLVILLLSGKIQEVRPVEEISNRNIIFRVIGIKPI